MGELCREHACGSKRLIVFFKGWRELSSRIPQTRETIEQSSNSTIYPLRPAESAFGNGKRFDIIEYLPLFDGRILFDDLFGLFFCRDI